MSAVPRRTLGRRLEPLVEAVIYLCGFSAVLFVLGIFVFVFREGEEFLFHRLDLRQFLTSPEWYPQSASNVRYGALALIIGTLSVTTLAMLIAVPFGLGAAIYVSEFCRGRLKEGLKIVIELLAAIPSVIYGLWGVAVFAPVFRDAVAKPVSRSLGQVIPALAGPVAVGRGMMVAGVVLAIMILPTIAAITRDVLAVVPNTQREVMLALGATRWEVIWQSVLPYARAGVIGGVMLGLGRALGETMAATMLIGNSQRLSSSLFAPGVTAASLVASELTNANSPLHESALIEVALVLFGITLMLNLFARLLVWQVSRGPAGARI